MVVMKYQKFTSRLDTDLVSIINIKPEIKIISGERLEYIKLIAPELPIFDKDCGSETALKLRQLKRERHIKKSGYYLHPIEWKYVKPIDHLVDFVDVFFDYQRGYPDVYAYDLYKKTN